MKAFLPRNPAAAKTSSVKLSSHLVKPAHFASQKISIKAPKIASKRSVGKIKI